jgi:hypothetical protein
MAPTETGATMGDEYTSEAGVGPGGPPSQQVTPDTQTPGDSAQHESPGAAEAAPNEPGDGETVCRAEFNKVVGQRQAAKEKVRQLTAELEQLSARLGAAPGQEELDAFREWKQLRQAGGAAGDQPASPSSPSSQEPTRQDQAGDGGVRKDALERRLMDLLRDQELRAAAVRAHAINPEQVVALLRDRVRMVQAPDGRLEPEFLDAGDPAAAGGQGPGDVQALVDLFLSRADSANLVRSMVTPGSGARQAGGLATHLDFMPRSKAEFLSLPSDQRLAVANRMTRQQRDAILGRTGSDGGGYL